MQQTQEESVGLKSCDKCISGDQRKSPTGNAVIRQKKQSKSKHTQQTKQGTTKKTKTKQLDVGYPENPKQR